MDQTPAKLPAVDARAIIERGKEVLIVRNRDEDPDPGLWTFPGGVVEPDSSPEVCLRRHARKRLGVRLELIVGQPPFIHEVEGKPVTFRYYIAGVLMGEPSSDYWPEIQWVHKARLSEYDFDPQARQVAEWLAEGLE